MKNRIIATAYLAIALSLGAVAEKLPNFIVILADDQGWGTTSVMNDPAVPESKRDFFQTPEIEQLARRLSDMISIQRSVIFSESPTFPRSSREGACCRFG
jgi:hypothetical protein